MTQVTLYGKPGCCFCDEAAAAVRAVHAERRFELHEIDVSLDPVMNREYGERIPVVAIDGVEEFEFHVGEEALRAALDRSSPSLESER